MGHILHDWDLQEKRLLLEKAYEALPEGGALVVYEGLIDDERRENTFGLLMSLNMLWSASSFSIRPLSNPTIQRLPILIPGTPVCPVLRTTSRAASGLRSSSKIISRTVPCFSPLVWLTTSLPKSSFTLCIANTSLSHSHVPPRKGRSSW
jgi:hypothetical protein